MHQIRLVSLSSSRSTAFLVILQDPGCNVTPSAPTLHHFFEPFHFLAGDQLVVPIGASHISLPLQEIQSREWEKKEQTNNMLGLTQVQKGSYVTLCICRLTLAWISCENSTTLLECQPILIGLHSQVWTLSHANSSLCCPVSTGHSRHSSPTAFLELLCPTLWPAFPSYFRSRRDLESKTLCLVSRQNRQRGRLLGGPPT